MLRRLFASLPLLLLGSVQAAPETLNLMTSYPQAVVAQFEAAFERAHPELRLNILWRMPNDARDYLMQPEQGGVDVLWMPSQRTFRALKAAGALGPIGIERSGLPKQIGQTALADPDGYYLASEIAGYGLLLNPARLAALGVTEPRGWDDLHDPRLAGEVVLPIPSGVGYAPMLVDLLLQSRGWAAGWASWRAIAVNSRLVGTRGNFASEEVVSGRAAVGLTMDFFATASLAEGAEGRFVYPAEDAFNPAHIAITAATPRRAAAEAFVTFVLSAEGQRLLFHPSIRKLPIRPAVYAEAPAGYANPFELAARSAYDEGLGLARRELVSELFDAAITRLHRELQEAHRLLAEAQRRHADDPGAEPLLARARSALDALPLDAPADDDATLRACATRHDSPEAETQCAAAGARWQAFFAARYSEASAIARGLLGDAAMGLNSATPEVRR